MLPAKVRGRAKATPAAASGLRPQISTGSSSCSYREPHAILPIHAQKRRQSATPEEDPLLRQRRQGPPLSDEHLHQMRREPSTPLHVARAHLLQGEESMLSGAW